MSVVEWEWGGGTYHHGVQSEVKQSMSPLFRPSLTAVVAPSLVEKVSSTHELVVLHHHHWSWSGGSFTAPALPSLDSRNTW